MATMASAARDILTTSGRDNLTAVAARSVPVTRTHPHHLPTPPNSISPALPPHGLKAQLLKARLEAVDSDLDLGHGQFDTAGAHTGPGSPPHDQAGALTPAVLSKYHLPDILLSHGPLAIRHVMGYLTASVPGFSGIPPAKARRLVVGALEGRGSNGEGGGVDGDVEFEKVGWGKWSARRRGNPRRDLSPQQMVDDISSPYMAGIPITKGAAAWSNERTRLGVSASSAGHSLAFSHDDRDVYMLDNEVDNMSMDGSASASCSEAPDDDDDVEMNDDPEDMTDDEDWAAVGAAALRAASYSKSAAQPSFLASRIYGARSCGMQSVPTTTGGMARPPQMGNFDFSAMMGASDAQEREAVEALLSLGGSV